MESLRAGVEKDMLTSAQINVQVPDDLSGGKVEKLLVQPGEVWLAPPHCQYNFLLTVRRRSELVGASLW